MTFGTLQVSYLDVGNTLVYALTHSSCARWLQYKEVLNISTVHQPRRLQRHTLPVLCLSKERLSTVSYQASSSSSICFLLDGRCISRLSTFYFQGGILANFLSFSFPHGCRRYMLCFIFALVKISISFVSKVFLTLSNSRRSKAFHWRQNRFEILQHIKKLKGGGWGSIKAPPPPLYHVGDTSLRVRPNQICVVSFLYSYKDDLLENLGKIKPVSKNAKSRRPVDVRRSKTSLLKLRNVDRRPPLQRGSRCFDTVFWRPSQYFSIALKVICCMLEFK